MTPEDRYSIAISAALVDPDRQGLFALNAVFHRHLIAAFAAAERAGAERMRQRAAVTADEFPRSMSSTETVVKGIRKAIRALPLPGDVKEGEGS